MDKNEYLYRHGLWVNDVYLVLVPTPDTFPRHHSHTADGLFGSAQVQQVVVQQIPLAVCRREEEIHI